MDQSSDPTYSSDVCSHPRSRLPAPPSSVSISPSISCPVRVSSRDSKGVSHNHFYEFDRENDFDSNKLTIIDKLKSRLTSIKDANEN
jgi:hypothetical protein